jgi:RimJ/RimL family protein N-acetyltransferase
MSIKKSKSALHLRGTAVELRIFTQDNLTESYLGWLRDTNLMRFSNQRFRTHSMESCHAYMASFATSENLFMAIYYKSSFIGTITVYRSLAHGTADIGLLISPSVQGKGLGKDAWITLMTYLLNTGTRKVTGGTLRCNVAMVRIMESSGMHPDGVRVGQELVDGVAHDMLHYAKFAQTDKK